jgi:hypothetical protein
MLTSCTSVTIIPRLYQKIISFLAWFTTALVSHTNISASLKKLLHNYIMAPSGSKPEWCVAYSILYIDIGARPYKKLHYSVIAVFGS